MKFRGKVVEIEAVRWDAKEDGEAFWNGETPACLSCGPSGKTWLVEAVVKERTEPGAIWKVGDDLQVRTLEGVMTARPGDWIIRGTEGELYPCKPSVFERKYEAV